MSLPFKEVLKNSLFRLFTLYARTVDFAQSTGPFVVIAPHPDDETLGCGALIARLTSQGKPVFIIVVTDGSAAGQSKTISAVKLADIRRQEVIKAGAALGVTETNMIFLNLADSKVSEQLPYLEATLRGQLQKLKPACLFSPFGIDRHPDHRSIANVINDLWQTGIITCPLYEYPVWFWSAGAAKIFLQPKALLGLRRVPTIGFLEAKRAALAAHSSQMAPPTNEAGWFRFPEGFLERFFTDFELFFEKPLRK